MMLEKPTCKELEQMVKELENKAFERRGVEEALRESELKYRSMMESMDDPVYICSPDYHVEYMNAAMVKQIGRNAVGKLCYEALNELDHKCPWCVYDKVQKGENCVTEIFSLKDNRTYSISHSPVHHLDGSVSKLSIYRDITEIKAIGQQLQQSRKMEAIATLAGGIAHQFNNALSAITGYTELLEMNYPQDETIVAYAGTMKQAAHRMAHLTHQLLSYARGGKYMPMPISLSRFVEDTLPLIRHTLKPGIRLETDFPPDVMPVEADKTQMQLVLSAIVANSNEAVNGPGRIRISLRNIVVEGDSRKDHPDLKPGPYVCLSIEDDGKGMDRETRDRIFEPFFTTHFIGRGLGMPAAYGIVKNHHGAITVDSELGKWTLVNLYLPAIGEMEPAAEEVVSGPEAAPAGGEGTILVIEDEAPLLKMNRWILEKLGYRVLEAMTGEAAVALARTFDGRIDLALLDMKLPDMYGDKVYPLIMEARPNLKVIVCSGYDIDGPAREVLDAGAEGFVQKPFSIAILADKLKEVLGGISFV